MLRSGASPKLTAGLPRGYGVAKKKSCKKVATGCFFFRYYQPKLYAKKKGIELKITQSYNMGVSKNRGTPNSSILIGFSMIFKNHFTPSFGNPHIFALF